MTARHELGTAPPARRALAERLSFEVATAAAEFIKRLIDERTEDGSRFAW